MRYAMAIDVKRCIGCHACAMACKMENNLPNNIWWSRILTSGGQEMDTAGGTYPNLHLQYIPLACQHCEDPACVKACPVGATYKREEDGIVIQDYDKCIGCRYCMVACPYSGVRQFNWSKPEYYFDIQGGDVDVVPHQYNTVEKCTFCVHRLARGEQPACIDVCTVRARYFGDIDDPESEISKVLKSREHFRLLESKGTGPAVYYLT
jgi:molybdopterin-containing oxidoreductase family iron-sulfur binding subunit